MRDACLGGPCFDSKYCEKTGGFPCPTLQSCFPSRVGFFCGSYPVPATLRVMNGLLYPGGDIVTLNETDGGEILGFTVAMGASSASASSLIAMHATGNTTFIRSVAYGRTAAPLEYLCISFNATSIGNNKMNVSCEITAGYGKDMHFSVESCHNLVAGNLTCVWVMGSDVFHYRPPSCTPARCDMLPTPSPTALASTTWISPARPPSRSP